MQGIIEKRFPFFRGMPNTAIAIKQSMTCICNTNASKEDIEYVAKLFKNLGEVVTIDEKLLTAIASETGGKYFRAKDNTGLENIYKEIDGLEKSKVEITTLTRYTEKFFPFVMIALGLLLIEIVLRFTVLKKFP